MNLKSVFRRAAGMCLSATLLLAAVPLMTASAEDTTEKITFDHTPVKVACVGASTTEGTKGHSYPAYLQIMLGNGFEVRNFGYPGCSVIKNQAYSYIGTNTYYENSLAYGADIVIIDMGVNDAQPGFYNGGNNTFEQDYDELVSSYLNQPNQPLVLLSIGGRIYNGPSVWGHRDELITDFVMPAQQKIAEKYDLPTADLRGMLVAHDEYFDTDDGVHYTGPGYRAMAQLYYDELVKLIDMPEGEGSDGLIDPPNRSVDIGEYDGYRVLQWLKGQKQGFSYDSGTLAVSMGIEEGTVVKNLTIDVTYFWDWHAGGNDWWHFNTTDKDGLTAPSVDGSNPHDNGFGTFSQYGMQRGKWAVLSVSRDDQTLGSATGVDWSVNVGDFHAENSLYIRGYVITATLADGTQKSVTWGSPLLPADKTALEKALEIDVSDVEYTQDSYAAYVAARDAAKAVNDRGDATQEEVDAATQALTDAIDGLVVQPAFTLGDLDDSGEIDSSDARIVLQSAVGKVDLTDVQRMAADVNGDGEIDSSDARIILQVSVGKAEL